jgi:carbamoyl-phosphate synthase small subunit
MTREKHNQKAILMLADGKTFDGFAIGKIGTTSGEICFNTGMTGYQEIFTDPSYFGQIVVATHVHIGNYGVKNDENESKGIKIAGLVCRNFSYHQSRIPADKTLEAYFLEEGLTGISGVDTRALVRYIRNKGAMNAIISSEIFDHVELKKKLDAVPSMQGLELSSKVSRTESEIYGAENAKHKVALLDLGVKENIIRCLVERDCLVKVFPAKTSLDTMLAFQPDGFMISNGPGDPEMTIYAVETLKQILEKEIPVFGICLGHQLLAKAAGAETFKMFNGHRGINHPIFNIISGKGEITSQNHGFAVSKESVEAIENIEITHVHLNDHTVAGIKIKNKPAFSVQYHPEAAPGPHDSRYLFDEFVGMMETIQLKMEN